MRCLLVFGFVFVGSLTSACKSVDRTVVKNTDSSRQLPIQLSDTLTRTIIFSFPKYYNEQRELADPYPQLSRIKLTCGPTDFEFEALTPEKPGVRIVQLKDPSTNFDAAACRKVEAFEDSHTTASLVGNRVSPYKYSVTLPDFPDTHNARLNVRCGVHEFSRYVDDHSGGDLDLTFEVRAAGQDFVSASHCVAILLHSDGKVTEPATSLRVESVAYVAGLKPDLRFIDSLTEVTEDIAVDIFNKIIGQRIMSDCSNNGCHTGNPGTEEADQFAGIGYDIMNAKTWVDKRDRFLRVLDREPRLMPPGGNITQELDLVLSAYMKVLRRL